MAKLKLQEFIAEHSDWEVLLAEKPYCITITRDEVYGKKLVMFKYSQIDSDFNLEIVRECRGCILDAETFEPVCIPFYKFGNAGESYCPKIDWKSCWVGQKLDGSLIKMVRIGDEILVSTNGTIDAFKAPLAEQIGCTAKTFGELVNEALRSQMRQNSCSEAAKLTKQHHLTSVIATPRYLHGVSDTELKQFLLENIEPGNTYMFELTSPFNKVVVTWHETRLNFLGVRNNATLQETYFTDHPLKDKFNTPKVFPLTSLEECMKAASELDVNEEGYVVCDSHFNRVKVKSPVYVALHHMRNNGVLSYERGIEIVRGNELGEVLTYFPEFKEHLDKIKERYDDYVASLEKAADELDAWIKNHGYDKQPWWIEAGGQKRKDVAIFITKNFKVPGVGFAIIDKKVASVKEWVEQVPAKNLVRALGFKDT